MAKGAKNDLLWLIVFSVLVKVCIVCLGVLVRATAYMGHLVADVGLWTAFWERCQEGEIPAADFGIEYPVATSLFYWALTPLASLTNGSAEGGLLLHAILASLMDVVNVAILYCILRGTNQRLALPLSIAFLLLPTSLALSPVRIESYVISTVLLGYWWHRNGRRLAATFFWSVGWWVKWFPAFLIAAQQYRAISVEKRRWEWLGAGAVFVGVAVALNLPFILANLHAHGDLESWSFPYRFHAARGIAGDTVLGVATIWLGELSLARYSTIWTLGLLAAAMFVKQGMRLEYRFILICISLFICNRIYSTQFNLWFYPFVILAGAHESSERRGKLLLLLFTLDVVNILVYPVLFTLTLEEIGSLEPLAAKARAGVGTVLFSVAIVLRAVLLAGFANFILRSRRENQPDV